MHPGLQGQRGVRVVQVMQADLGQLGLVYGLPEVARDALRVEGGSVLGREHEPGLDPGPIPLVLLIELPSGLCLEYLDGAWINGVDPAAFGGLWLADYDVAVDGNEGAPDREPAGLEVDV